MKRLSLISFYSIALLYSSSAMAVETQDVTILNTVTKAMSLAATDLIGPMALGWLGAFMTLQFTITNLTLLRNGGDISDVFTKLIGFLFAGGISILLLKHGPGFIDSVGHGIFEKFLKKIPSAGAIITATLGICTTLIAAIFAIGIIHTAIANLLAGVVLIVFGAGMYMALKVFMLYLELGMVILLSPLSFSFLGLSAFREQGTAPLKQLISLIYRAVVLGVVYAALGEIVTVAGKNLDAISWTNPTAWPSAVNTIFSMLCAYPVLVYMAFKSDSMAAALANGSTSMGPSDVASTAATAAAAGALAGAAVASGGATMAAGTPSKALQSMGDFMKGINSSISNASNSGRGRTPAPDSAPQHPSLSSIKDGPTGENGAPTRPSDSNVSSQDDSLPMASGGAPVRPGSGSTAGVGGAGQSEAARNPTFKDVRNALKDFSHHVEKEKASTSISINTHNSD